MWQGDTTNKINKATKKAVGRGGVCWTKFDKVGDMYYRAVVFIKLGRLGTLCQL